MHRFAALLAAFSLVVLACGGSDGASPTVTTDASTGATGVLPAPAKDIEGPAAPDFELALGRDAGTFSLSAEQKPVYMVFWAEW